jgi:cytosolic carboxypeptidase protein 2/3
MNSSDESAMFDESETPSAAPETERPDLDELYKHIPPPIPLIPKNKYHELINKFELKRDDRASNFLQMPEISKKKPSDKSPGRVQNTADVLQDLSKFCQGRTVAYKREVNESGQPVISSRVKIDDLSKLPRFDFKRQQECKNDSIEFDSRFESGNLGLAIKSSECEYDLLMQNDINTKGHTQWFYFKVMNSCVQTVKFNILNFSKKDSLFNYGMQVLIHSEKNLKKNSVGWHRGGQEISYYANELQRNAKHATYYTLTFTYEFLYENDVVYFAYCYPYTYTELCKEIEGLESMHSEIMSRSALCLTLADKKCEKVVITAPGTSEEVKKRKGAVITARVHPGETVGSWMMKGFMEFILSDSNEAVMLRNRYVFTVIPMLNPDGVVFGNYRCGLAGCDLNRTWKVPSKLLHPTIYAAKKLIRNFAKERTVDFICDFHGHSKKKNIFMYGCNVADSPEVTRCIPYTLSKISNYFSYKYCSFKVQKSKEATMRVSLFKELKIPLVYTLEASFYGADFVRNR